MHSPDRLGKFYIKSILRTELFIFSFLCLNLFFVRLERVPLELQTFNENPEDLFSQVPYLKHIVIFLKCVI